MGPLRSGERAQQRGFGELPLPGRRRLDIYVGDVFCGALCEIFGCAAIRGECGEWREGVLAVEQSVRRPREREPQAFWPEAAVAGSARCRNSIA